jgi:hypothetical protein
MPRIKQQVCAVDEFLSRCNISVSREHRNDEQSVCLQWGAVESTLGAPNLATIAALILKEMLISWDGDLFISSQSSKSGPGEPWCLTPNVLLQWEKTPQFLAQVWISHQSGTSMESTETEVLWKHQKQPAARPTWTQMPEMTFGKTDPLNPSASNQVL